MQHDQALFDEFFSQARLIRPDLRSKSMFGCPALFLGRRMIGCVYGESIGLKVPSDLAAKSLGEGRVVAFRPYGKPSMPEWVQIDGGKAGLKRNRDLITAGVAFAEAAPVRRR